MNTSVFDSVLLQNSWSTLEMREIFSERQRVQSWLNVEAALALEQAKLGMIPQEAADEIASKCLYDCLDFDFILEQFKKTKHPLVPTVRGIEKACKDGLGEYVHFGATTQDIIDTGLVLQLKEAHFVVKREVKAIAKALFNLSKTHSNTAMMGRTLALQAIPITFGHKTAIWLSEMVRHLERLEALEERCFVGCMVGAVGTKASFGDKANEMEKAVNDHLGLGTPNISWQPARDNFYELGSVLGGINATLNKIGNQLLILAHNEIDEIGEPFGEGQVGSSTMPHKRNPAITENSVTVSTTIKGNIYLLNDITKHNHERDGSVWKMECKVLPEIYLMLSVVLDNLRFVLEGLEVKEDKMLKNLNLLGGSALAERVMFELADKGMGKQDAHEEVYKVAMQGFETGTPFKKSLLGNGIIMQYLSEEDVDKILDPTTYVGHAPEAVEHLLSQVESYLFHE